MSDDDDYLASIGGGSAPSAGRAAVSGQQRIEVTPEPAGRYERGIELGRGGIGKVYLGYDRHIGRDVAIKELLDASSASVAKESGGSSVQAERFLREARVTGRLEHPAIIPVYELGARADGSLYYTMKYVRGRTLADSLAECHDLESRLGLLQHVANLSNAIAFAHAHRVLHRDIKPPNVMVGSYGETVVLDWGLAKVLGDPELVRGERRLKSPTEQAATLDGHALGTPAYMSPEQAEGRIEDVDERSDVWGLGAVLYELLAGVPPYTGVTPYEIVGKVITTDPPSILDHEPGAPKELVAVAEKALSRKPNDRYENASEFADELEAFRSGRRVEAHRYSTVELLLRVWRRHRSAVVVAAVALVAALFLVIYAYDRVSDERDRAIEAEVAAKVRLGRALYEKAQVALERRDWLAAEALTAASLNHDDNAMTRGLLLAPDRRWEPQLGWVRGFGWACARIRFAPDGESVACPTLAGVAVLSSTDGREIHRFVGGTGFVVDVAWADDGQTLAGLSSDGSLLIWSAGRSQALVSRRAYNSRATALAADFGSGLIATGGVDESVTVWRWSSTSAERLWRGEAHKETVSAVAIEPGGERMASADESGTVVLWSRDGEVLRSFRPHRDRIVDVRFQLDSIFTASHDKRIVVTRLADGATQELGAHDGGVASLSAAPGRDLVASGDERGTVRFWAAQRRRPQSRFTAHSAAVTGIDISPDGSAIATSSQDGVVRLWTFKDSVAPDRLTGEDDGFVAVDWSANGLFVAAGGRSGRVRVWRRSEARPLHTFQLGESAIASVALNRTGDRIAVADDAGHMALVALGPASPEAQRAPKRIGRNPSLLITPATDEILVGDADRHVTIYGADLMSKKLLGHHRSAVNSVAVAPGGAAFASSDVSGEIAIWHDDGDALRIDDYSAAAAVSFIDERLLLSGYRDGTVVIWDSTDGSMVDRWSGHDEPIRTVAAHGEAALIATSAEDHVVRIWRLPERSLLAAIDTSDAVLGLAFSPDGSELAGVNDDDEVLIWSVARALEPVESLRAEVRSRFGLAVDGVDVVPISGSD